MKKGTAFTRLFSWNYQHHSLAALVAICVMFVCFCVCEWVGVFWLDLHRQWGNMTAIHIGTITHLLKCFALLHRPQRRTHDLGGLNGLSLEGTPVRRGSLWAFCKQKVFSSAAAWETLIRRTLASRRSCFTAFWAMTKLLLAALLFDMTESD